MTNVTCEYDLNTRMWEDKVLLRWHSTFPVSKSCCFIKKI